MTMKQLAHLAQQSLQARARCIVKRSHVHELLAAALGFGSWAALIAEALPVDAGVSDLPSDVLPRLTARAIQLGYGQGAAEAIGRVLQELCVEQQLSTVRWSELMALMEPVAWPAISDEELEDDEGDWNDDPASEIDTRAPMRDRLLRSPLLLDGLGRWADGGGAERHRILANLLHCKRPDPYLYEESLKGRVLNAAERAWVDDYLRVQPRFERYEQHLRAAALGGIRTAAAEYAAVFDSREFFELAERLAGDVDADRMAAMAPTRVLKDKWLREAADQGSESALRQLVRQGDRRALEQLAVQGDVDALRDLAEQALGHAEPLRAWMWQYLALLHHADLTKSTLAAYHDGGPQHGQFYDSDFGGGLYVDGDSGIRLPAIASAEHGAAEALAREKYRDRQGRSPTSPQDE